MDHTEKRSIRPPSESNPDNVDTAPGTVGPPTATPGDPDGVVFVPGEDGTAPPPVPRPSAWSGWPADWNTPAWTDHAAALADTAWACLDLNSSVLASMPPYLIDPADTLNADWLNNPDPDRYASWEDFAKQLFWTYQLGEAFLIATSRYASGYPARFHALEPWMVDVELSGPVRSYFVGGVDVTADVLHIRYTTRTGAARGVGPLDAGRSRLVAAEVLNRYATNLAASGGVPPGTLEHPDELDSTQATDLQTQWVTARMSKLGLPAVLSGGVKWNPTAVSPADMALIELAQFNESRIAVLLGVPPFLVGLPSGGDSMTYSNVTSVFDFHWRGGLRPKAAPVCAALSGWLLPRGTSVEVNRDDYVRPDPKTRAETWKTYLDAGVLTVDEVRAIERFGAGGPAPRPMAPTPAVAGQVTP